MEYDINVNNNNYKKRGAYMKIYEENGKLYVESDYSREFVKGAKLLNGTWSGKAWVFNPENEEHVRKLLLDVYGCDGKTAVETVTVRVYLDKIERVIRAEQSLEMFGKVLVRRAHRDRCVNLHPDAIVVAGSFPGYGGSVKNPRLENTEGTVIEVKNVAVAMVNKDEEFKDAIEIISEPKVSVKSLLEEKENLIKRLEEIDKLLKNLE